MDAINQEVETVPRSICQIRDDLMSASQKRHELVALLGEIQKEVCHYLILKRLTRDQFDSIRRNAREKSWETERYVENLHSATNKLSVDQLQRVFVEADHLLKMPVLDENGCRRYSLNPLQPFSQRKKCRHCGLPLPPGGLEFCSDFCSGNSPKDSHAGKRGETEYKSPVDLSSSKRQTGSEMREGPHPNSGPGNRNTECDYYDACLNLAIFEEWESFHCDRCGYRDAYHALPQSEEPW